MSAEQIAAELNAAPSAIKAELARLDAAGRIRLNAVGHVLGSAGLSVESAAHELWLGSRRFWTWCAYDVVGIVGALRANAQSLSRSPASGSRIELDFEAGRPPASSVVIFFPDDRWFVKTIDDWCSNANFFENREVAVAWSGERKLPEEVIELEEARRRGLPHWSPMFPAHYGFESRQGNGNNG